MGPLDPRSNRNLPHSDFPLDFALLKNYVCKTLPHYCIPGCETLEGKTRNHYTQTPNNGKPPVQRLSVNRFFAVRLLHRPRTYITRSANSPR